MVNLAETCDEENPVQIITDYAVDKNTVDDTQMLKNRLPVVQEKMEITDLYVDGGYYSEEVELKAQDSGTTVHYTDMTEKKPASNKIPLTSFTIKDNKIIVSCPKDEAPLRAHFNESEKTLSFHFDLNICKTVPGKR